MRDSSADDSDDARRGGVQAIDRAVAILNTFTRDEPELPMSEISRRLRLSTSTTHRLLTSLQSHGLVEQVGSRRYALGPHLRRLSYVAGGRSTLRESARPIMQWLRDVTNETVGLHIVGDGPHRLIIDQVESQQELRRTYTDLGEPIPIHQGAPGKLLLAFLPDLERQEVLTRQLEVATANTLTDPATLRDELARIVEQGYATSWGERTRGIGTVAVPVRDHTGAVIAALSVTGPDTRMARGRIAEAIDAAVRAGNELSVRLGADEAYDRLPSSHQ